MGFDQMPKKKEKTESFAQKTGRRLREIRGTCTSNKLNQDEFATMIGCPPGTYGNYERGDRQLPPDIRENILKLFDEDPYDFSSVHKTKKQSIIVIPIIIVLSQETLFKKYQTCDKKILNNGMIF